MSRLPSQEPERGGARERLLEAACHLIRHQGFTGTSVEDLCQAAGVTKGAYFHHFKSKEALGVSAAEYWVAQTEGVFTAMWYGAPTDPLLRILAYLSFRKSVLGGQVGDWTCLLGTMAQEVYGSHPTIREACADGIFGHAATLEPDIAAAMATYGAPVGWTAASLAQHIQAVIQGSFILAKASDSPTPVVESLDHLARYIRLLFPSPAPQLPGEERRCEDTVQRA
jgi:TetR/AcrR family transcriptional repressor of nem operon